ncbi:type VII secretion protein EssA [Alkalicoccobacillus murimartini]|uniref:Type VII secretion protein EssA n=1 Tax=Alkalicoccobacillus murimartini TaxID=171685 RepID=A0ABT9YKV2_9BACI|nr:type VII secretion protein EssA [Alkalicoccobacillus murimartini]MDQ0208507.1 type VII secretion protein EssA [Alkalicoccobacillus murimartini]
MKARYATLLLCFFLFGLTFPVSAADELNYERIEPNEYVQKQIELRLSRYAEENTRSASSLPEEQLLLTFEQKELSEEEDLRAELFITPLSGQASLENEIERYKLFSQEMSRNSMSASQANVESSNLSLSTLLIFVVVALLIVLFIWLIPKINNETN